MPRLEITRKLFVVCAALLMLDGAPAAPLVTGLDHIPVAVRDLDRASKDFANLGFVIKPGRLHEDGIRNNHIKFSNGSGIELITAPSPTDDLATEYHSWLNGGDGPAFWSLYSSDLATLTAALARLKLDPINKGDIVNFSQSSMPHRLFFADRLRSLDDGPSYWDHPNTAYKLQGVWLAGVAQERQLLLEFGARQRRGDACSPFDRRADMFMLPGEGDQVMVSAGVRRSPERAIVGATVLVRSLTVARHTLDANHVRYMEAAGCRNHAIWITPGDAHNLWLEFTE